MKLIIHFDGGTPCNVPSRGYGIGYGSYAFNGGLPVRLNHGIACSANAAEILTIACALEKLAEMKCPRDTPLHVQGDSQIALAAVKRCAAQVQKKRFRPGSPEFMAAQQRLFLAVQKFSNVTTEWLPRKHAVAAFGH